MPWHDTWGTAAAIGISVLLEMNFHRHGRHDYRTGFYWSLGNLAISIFAFVGNYGVLIGGWLAVPYFLAVSSVSYFATPGTLVTFARPKNVRCFRCEYVDYPHETEDHKTPFDEQEWRAFRSLNAEVVKARKNND